MLKILHVGKYFPPRYGGIETFMSQLMEEQAKKGLEVAAVVHTDKLQSKSGEYLWNSCNVFEVKSYGQLIFAPVAPTYPFKLIKALRYFKPNVVHIHMPNLSAFWMLAFKSLFVPRTKIVIHWHADVLGSSPTILVKLFYPVYKLFETQLLNIANRVVATSPPYLETSVPLNPFLEKCEVVPLGIKLNEFDIHRRTFINDGVLRLCMIGRLVYYKGHSLVLNALLQLRERNISVHLDVIGNGELNTKLHGVCSRLGLNDMVTWHGSVSEDVKQGILKKSDLLLLPSLERTEAFGVVLLEAASLGVPALISDVKGSGMSYVVEDGLNGLITKTSDSESIVQSILNLVSEKQLRDYSSNAYAKVLSQFDIKAVSAGLSKIYTELIND